MQINKRNRTELKAYFVKNAIPTENNFAELVDATIVQKDDGLAKLPGTPLSVEAAGDDTSQKDVIALYKSFADANAEWSVSLNPRLDPNNPQSARAGFSINDGAGRSRLFIDRASGSVGIGTNNPLHALHVRTGDAVGMFESTGEQAFLRVMTREGLGNRVELCNRPGGRLSLWTAAGGDALNVYRDGRVSVGTTRAGRSLQVGGDGRIGLQNDNNVSVNTTAGLYWHNNNDYSIKRTAGDWSGPDYQQLELRFQTGIVLRPGTGNNQGHGRSYVEITQGKGLRVTQGQTVLGVGGPSGLLKIGNNNHFMDVTVGNGGGRMGFSSWGGGWNLNTFTNGKHLHINRDSGDQTRTYIGRVGKELRVWPNGRVGILKDPSVPLDVNGDIHGHRIRAVNGLLVDGDLSQHIDADGAFYRLSGQAYLVVDDNLYIRDAGGGVKFHFDTNLGVLRQDGWTNAAFRDGWVNYGNGYNNAGYYRDREGVTHLRGLVRGGHTGGGRTIMQLPAGYRPAGRELRCVQTMDHVGRVDITNDGRVIPYIVNNGWVSLDGISFRTV